MYQESPSRRSPRPLRRTLRLPVSPPLSPPLPPPPPVWRAHPGPPPWPVAPPPVPRRSVARRWPGLVVGVVAALISGLTVTAALLLPPAAAGQAPPAVPTVGVPAFDEPGDPAPTGPEVRDTGAGVSYRLPAGWQESMPEGEYVSTITSSAHRGETAFVAVGVADGSLDPAALGAAGPGEVAEQIASVFGEFFVPVPGVRREQVSEATTVDGRPAWTAGYVVVPDDAGRDRVRVAVTVVDDGGRLVYALSLLDPADRAAPGEADAIVAGLRFG